MDDGCRSFSVDVAGFEVLSFPECDFHVKVSMPCTGDNPASELEVMCERSGILCEEKRNWPS